MRPKSVFLYDFATKHCLNRENIANFVCMKEVRPLNIPAESKPIANAIFSGDYAVNCGVHFSEQPFFTIGQPYALPDFRIMALIAGSATITLNLVNYTITAGTIVFCSAGTIAELQSISDDAYIKLIGTRNEIATDFVCVASDVRLMRIFEHTIGMIVEELETRNPSYEFVRNQIAALVAYAQHNNCDNSSGANNLKLNQFISLVNAHCHKQRGIPFYAEKLNITPHYLSALIKQQSGISVMDWINRAVVQRAKILLRSGKTTLQTSEELNFPSSTYFNRYFKRHTNLTPSEFKIL